MYPNLEGFLTNLWWLWNPLNVLRPKNIVIKKPNYFKKKLLGNTNYLILLTQAMNNLFEDFDVSRKLILKINTKITSKWKKKQYKTIFLCQCIRYGNLISSFILPWLVELCWLWTQRFCVFNDPCKGIRPVDSKSSVTSNPLGVLTEL